MPSPDAPEREPPPIAAHAGPLLERYDVALCDVWGVIHDGRRAYGPACDALERFRAGGGTVVLVTNAPVPEERVKAMLDLRQVPHAAYDGIVSSGAIALQHVRDAGYAALATIGPQKRDSALFRQLTQRIVPVAAADAILCSGLVDDETETAESYRPLLETALHRATPFVCANPDLVVDVAGRLYPCAGAIADLYERMSGPVFWAGKPHASAYDCATALAERVRDRPVARARTLAIGDSLRTDLKGAANAGMDALFIGSGIHREEVVANGAIDPQRLARLFGPDAPPAIAAQAMLAW
jgi:HAD superfamily hydrolase (TIGR01459 family)